MKKWMYKSSFLLIVVLITACGESPLYTKAFSFKNNEWDQEVKPVFKVNIPDTTSFYTVDMTIRTTTDYPNNNLWMFISARSPKGQGSREPLEVKIANPDGSWIGEKSGTFVETTVSYKHRRFPQKGWYTFTLEQGITEKQVTEIADVTYTVTKDNIQE